MVHNFGGIDYLWEKITSWDNLLLAYQNAAKGKWLKQDICNFSSNLGENLLSLQEELLKGTYRVGAYHEFFVYLPKKRLIMALGFKDRVVQWAIYQIINPIYDKKFIYHSYACRENKGSLPAVQTVIKWVQRQERQSFSSAYLKLDVSKFFYRINHEVLMNILKRDFPFEHKLVNLLSLIINCEHTPFGLPRGKTIDEVAFEEMLFDVGMPIGNLTSQLMANVYLNELDMFVKHVLKANKYIRYMDDIVILDTSVKRLNYYKKRINTFVSETLSLDLNSKTVINYTRCGMTFLGYRVFSTHIVLTKKTLNKMKIRLRFIAEGYKNESIPKNKVLSTLTSYGGLIEYCNSHSLKKWIVGNINMSDINVEAILFKEGYYEQL